MFFYTTHCGQCVIQVMGYGNSICLFVCLFLFFIIQKKKNSICLFVYSIKKKKKNCVMLLIERDCIASVVYMSLVSLTS
jgi:hypothetical protein